MKHGERRGSRENSQERGKKTLREHNFNKVKIIRGGKLIRCILRRLTRDLPTGYALFTGLLGRLVFVFSVPVEINESAVRAEEYRGLKEEWLGDVRMLEPTNRKWQADEGDDEGDKEENEDIAVDSRGGTFGFFQKPPPYDRADTSEKTSDCVEDG